MLDFEAWPESNLPQEKRSQNKKALKLYIQESERHVDDSVTEILDQWPTSHVRAPSSTRYQTYISVETAILAVHEIFESSHRNLQIQKHSQEVQAVMGTLNSEKAIVEQYVLPTPVDNACGRTTHVAFQDLFVNVDPPLPVTDGKTCDQWIAEQKQGIAEGDQLDLLLDQISSQSSNIIERRYGDDLTRSYRALQETCTSELTLPLDFVQILEGNLKNAHNRTNTIFQAICNQLQRGKSALVRASRMLPRLTPMSLLSLLANRTKTQVPPVWKKCLVQYGEAITTFQRLQRLLQAVENSSVLLEELQNPGHQDWDPMEYPEWLLLEIENGILIRKDQAEISREIMCPTSGENAVVQMNMGLGKSSVIVPIVAAALADTQKLVRVIVLRPLAMQMFQVLVNKLSGVINRRILYMPISRSLEIDVCKARQILKMYKDAMEQGSILLLQPEHLLSFELMGFEGLLSDRKEVGTVMTETQTWLHSNSRDILDESDEILSVRFELIYTLGKQRTIDFSPMRWTTIQHILGILAEAAVVVLQDFPDGLEVINHFPVYQGRFPRLRILRNEAGEALLKMVAQKICEKGLPGISVQNLPAKHRAALLQLLTKPKPTLNTKDGQALLDFASRSESLANGLLLLIGLFADGILKFALAQKRWRVNYGLDPSRSLLAVPYYAKDSPSAGAEFSHPDVAITLTGLSYYYGGLTHEQIRASFEALLQSDQAQETYDHWVADAPTLPVAFKRLTGINLNNLGQCSREIFPSLQYAKGVVDNYMATIVFPAELKEFPNKLSSSGWDIGREKTHLVTGFSGTNDSKYVLPLSIGQCDLPAQLSTNAAVLDCLLRPENSFADDKHESTNGVLDAESLLNMALTLKPPVRVILDVGAQVLEQNEKIAREWLNRMPFSEAQAVIFFDTKNDIYVLSRDGTKEPLLVSPFALQMDQCLVYLDDSHTRGTDLKLPPDYRAIVTLGPALTKDRLVQACMRMRKLGKGQSVVFCASMEVQRKILEYCGTTSKSRSIEVADVLKWCITETCTSLQRSIGLWATQGLRHQHRQAVLEGSPMTKKVVNQLLEPESQTLQQRYGISAACQEKDNYTLRYVSSQALASRGNQVESIRAKCRDFQVGSFEGGTMLEEQERELSPENEREQQIEALAKKKPRAHKFHTDVLALATQGVLNRSSDAFCPAFDVFANTSARTALDRTAWPADLLVTSDFANTLVPKPGQILDSFLKPVRWVLSRKSNSGIDFVVVSPFEAQELLPAIRQHQKITLHVFSPRLTKSMKSLEDLVFCANPPVSTSWSMKPTISRQLNLFAGQLYIKSYDDYVALCSFLGVCFKHQTDEVEVAPDGFINPAGRASSTSVILRDCTFKTSPVAFVFRIMALRRKGQGIAVSHLGRILNAELIQEDEF